MPYYEAGEPIEKGTAVIIKDGKVYPLKITIPAPRPLSRADVLSAVASHKTALEQLNEEFTRRRDEAYDRLKEIQSRCSHSMHGFQRIEDNGVTCLDCGAFIPS